MNSPIKICQQNVELAIFVCICILCSLSSKNPFKKEKIGNINKYFKHIPDNQILESQQNILNIANDQDNNIENNEFKDEMNYIFRRKLASESFCMDMYESFRRNEGKKMSYIFNIRYQSIRKISIALLCVNLSNMAASILFVCAFKKLEHDNPLLILLVVINVLTYIAKIVLSIILLYIIENGDIEKYDDFLDCKIVNKDKFKKFSDVNKLRRVFLAFMVLNIISEAVDKLDSLCSEGKDEQ